MWLKGGGHGGPHTLWSHVHWLQSWCWQVRGRHPGWTTLWNSLSDGVWRWHTGLKCHHPHGIHRLFLHLVYQLPPPAPKGNLRSLSLLALGTSLSFPECPLRWPLHLPIRVLSPWSPRPRLHWCASPEVVGYDMLPRLYLHVRCYWVIF